MPYDFKHIEDNWQKYWEENETFKTEDLSDKPKYYVLDMFPYPSGSGLHVGHMEGYTATDIIARFKRMQGYNVLHPMGWDAFGLPAGQYAVKTGIHPKLTTQKNIANFKKQLKSVGLSYNWDREVSTIDPKYYRWTQWIFLQLYQKGLAYIAEVPVNWCIELGTVLANEEVPEQIAKGYTVEKRPMRQWMLKITEYAERLLNDLDELDWPENIKEMQRNWIGKSEGADIDFSVKGYDGKIRVYTTRPDTLFGATFMVLAPEHHLVEKITAKENRKEVELYQKRAKRKSELERTQLSKEKTGIFTGAHAINPANGREIQIWIADYVLATYGTGAIMCVPCNDDRDWEFATKFDLPIIEVIDGGDIVKGGLVRRNNGKIINSSTVDNSFTINDLDIPSAIKKITDWLEEKKVGRYAINYKMRDWLFSRQRYWGEPFPIVHSENGTHQAVAIDELPVELPDLEDYKPTGTPDPPLSKAKEWIQYRDKEGRKFRRETNTMPQWAGSCWYYLRYLDPYNDEIFCALEKEKYWMPVDLYVGGIEHAILHLLYARFWHKVLYDLGYVSTKEPFKRLLNPGMILGYTYRYYRNSANERVPFDKIEWIIVENAQRAMHKDTNEELKVHYIPIDKVKWENEKPNHPDTGEELEVKMDKMSKSLGNTIAPEKILEDWGADSFRLYEMFMGPLEQMKPWNTKSIEGVHRFLKKVWNLFIGEDGNIDTKIADLQTDKKLSRFLHKTIKKVTDDIEKLDFNTAISQMMIFINELTRNQKLPKQVVLSFIKLLSPFAPHISEELWKILGNKKSIAYERWPEYDPRLGADESVTIILQVNGKVRGTIVVDVGTSEDELEKLAKKDARVKRFMDGKEIKNVIIVPDKLVNLVV